MTAFFAKIMSFLLAAIAFLFPWLNIGKTDAALTVELDANATTGYSWFCEIEDAAVLVLTGSEYKADATPPGMVGVGGIQYFYFDALAQGETDVTFTYRQNWAGGDTADIVVYTVTVDADKNVSYIVNE